MPTEVQERVSRVLGQADLQAGLDPAVTGMGTLVITPFFLPSPLFPPSPLVGPEHSLQPSQLNPNPGLRFPNL